MTIVEPEVARANLDAARAHYQYALRLEVAGRGAEAAFRAARREWNLALDEYHASLVAWEQKHGNASEEPA